MTGKLVMGMTRTDACARDTSMTSRGTQTASRDEVEAFLERRLGRLHARQRLGIEADHEAQAFGHGLNFFHIENWYKTHTVIRSALWLVGLYERGRRNARDVQLRRNEIRLARLP